MDAPSGHTNVARTLVDDLNALLSSLSLPITIETPYDLTPSLLIAILESLLRARLPISDGTRASRKPSEKVEAMKIFLGVLENDVFRSDMGLSEMDPRKLARGEWDEVVIVGEALCWLGTGEGLVGGQAGGEELGVSTYAGLQCSTLEDTAATSSPQAPDIVASPDIRPAKCIHQVEDLSFTFDDDRQFSIDTDPPSFTFDTCPHHPTNDSATSFCNCSESTSTAAAPHDRLHMVEPNDGQNSEASCDCPSSSARISVRYQGLINPVDLESEIKAFEASQTPSQTFSHTAESVRTQTDSRYPNSIGLNPTRHTSPAQYTLALLNERARLLEELAKFKLKMAKTSP